MAVGLAWDPSPDARVAGYFLCWGLASGQCTTPLNVGDVTSATVGGLTTNTVYYFNVVAYDATGQQAVPSNEVQYSITNSPFLPAATAGWVASSSNPALPGQTVTFTAFIAPVSPSAGTPTGTVQFKFDGANLSEPLSLSGGTAAYSTSTLAHGNHGVVAEYAGDGNFFGVTNQLPPVQLINSVPVAVGDTLERDPTNGVRVSIATLLSNDTDADSDPISFLGVSAISANGGTVVSNAGWVFYTPPVGFTNADTFTYTISDGYGPPVTGTVTVNIRVDSGPYLAISGLGNGSLAVRGNGIPGRTYRIQFATDPQNPAWNLLGPATADTSGFFVFTDTNGTSQRFYRSVYP